MKYMLTNYSMMPFFVAAVDVVCFVFLLLYALHKCISLLASVFSLQLLNVKGCIKFGYEKKMLQGGTLVLNLSLYVSFANTGWSVR